MAWLLRYVILDQSNPIYSAYVVGVFYNLGSAVACSGLVKKGAIWSSSILTVSSLRSDFNCWFEEADRWTGQILCIRGVDTLGKLLGFFLSVKIMGWGNIYIYLPKDE